MSLYISKAQYFHSISNPPNIVSQQQMRIYRIFLKKSTSTNATDKYNATPLYNPFHVIQNKTSTPQYMVKILVFKHTVPYQTSQRYVPLLQKPFVFPPHPIK